MGRYSLVIEHAKGLTSIGIGMMGTIKPALASLLALGVFTVQAFISQKWLETYRYGPLEWLWRSATYLKWQPMKK